MTLSVGFDLDGVGHHFGDGVRDYLNSIGRPYGYKDDAIDAHSWSFFEYWGMDRREFAEVCNKGVDAGYIFRGNVRPNFFETMRWVANLGHRIVIITDRHFGSTPAVSHQATREWLAENGAPDHELYFSADKTIVRTDIFVEDKISNYDELTAVGTQCWLINRPWNIDAMPDSRLRIDDIREYADKVIKLDSELSKIDN